MGVERITVLYALSGPDGVTWCDSILNIIHTTLMQFAVERVKGLKGCTVALSLSLRLFSEGSIIYL